MSEVRYGEQEGWEEEVGGGAGADFMNLVEGDNIVRIFTNPFKFQCAWITDSSGVNRKVRGAKENCPLVKNGYPVKPRWYVGVLERKTGAAKVLEISEQIYKGIKNLYSDPEWGDVRGYDVNVKRGPKKSQPLYTVMPRKPRDLSKEEKDIVSRFLDRVDMNKFIKPPTADEVQEKLDQILSKGGKTQTRERETPPTAKKEREMPTVSDDDFDSFDD